MSDSEPPQSGLAVASGPVLGLSDSASPVGQLLEGEKWHGGPADDY